MFKARSKDDVLFTRRKNLTQVEQHYHNDHNHKQQPQTEDATKSEDLLEIVDFDDVDETSTTLSLARDKLITWCKSVDVQMGPIDIETAIQLKTLLFGDSNKIIGTQWAKQYFEFDYRSSNLWYGLVQHKVNIVLMFIYSKR